ncbi:MAG TPA: helix-turn-helix transcriptional regulator [Pyrinomonadaceae bacterium]|nr:helix-turn-helix transcriptional regulator [Pyrinomonadaceae bacterium]
MGHPRPRQKNIGKKLLQIRERLDIPQHVMPARLGRPDLHPGRISEYENNDREPSLLTLLHYANLAGVHLEVIVNDNVELPDTIPGSVHHPLTPRHPTDSEDFELEP